MLILKPAGKVGDDEQLVIAPPEAVGVSVEIAVPTLAEIVVTG